MAKIILAFILFFSIYGLANTPESECLEHHIAVERIGPQRDQGVSGLCYAFEGADLVSFKLGRPVSALAMAFAYFYTAGYAKFNDLYEQGGDTQPAIENSQNLGGFCLESDLPSNEQVTGEAARIHDALIKMDDFNEPNSAQFEIAQLVFPSLDESTYLRSFRFRTKRERMIFLVTAVCKNRVTIPDLHFVHFAGETAREKNGLMQNLNAAMSEDNLVGIGFHSNAIYADEAADDAHAVTIIGRRWNPEKQTCQYHVRDNFGSTCDGYKPGLECDGGQIWLDEDTLKGSLTEVEYLQ